MDSLNLVQGIVTRHNLIHSHLEQAARSTHLVDEAGSRLKRSDSAATLLLKSGSPVWTSGPEEEA